MVYGRDLGTVDVGGYAPAVDASDSRHGLLAACRQFREMAPASAANNVAPPRNRQLGGFLGDPIMVISSALSTF
jgi:hypothetical protein